MSRRKEQRGRSNSGRPAATGARARALAIADTVCAEVREAAGRVLAREDRAEHVVDLAERTRGIALRVIQRLPDAGRHACQAGCAFCCHTGVTVAPAEAIAIARYLASRLGADERAELLSKIERNAGTAAAFTRAAYTAQSVRCALLTDDGNCRAHPVRPVACAGFLSTSREACEAEFQRMPGRTAVPLDQFAMASGLGAAYGLKEASARAGLDGQSFELHHALRAVWERPDAAARWAAGERLFAGCLRADDWERGP